MELIAKLWKNFKVQPEIWFFYGFFLSFTLTVRKVLWFFPLRGEFNEYSGIYLYLSDILLVLTLIAWIITILYNRIDILSMLKNVPPQKQKNCSTPKGMFHVEHPTGQAWNILRGRRRTLVLPLVLVIWSFISLIWAENKIVAIFRSVKILEFYLLYVFILVRFFYWNAKNNVPSQKECSTLAQCCENVPRGTFSEFTGWNSLKKIFSLIMVIGLFQAIIGIIQFSLQHSIGLFWLKESLISPSIAGVAKVIFNGEAFIRAYGLFPHPNIFGGFLVFSIFVSFLYYKMFHLSRNVPPQKQEKCSTPEAKELFHVEQFFAPGQVWNNLLGRYRTIILKLILGIQLLALILTFSKSAILGLFLGLVFYIYKNVPPQKECSTWNILRGRRGTSYGASVEHPAGQAWNILWGKHGTFMDFVRKKKRLIITASLIIIFAVFITKPDLYSFLFKGLNERLVYVDVSRGTIWDNLILGIGNGQFVLSMENLRVINENWMLEPVHNVFLLVWSELGFIGFGFLIWFIVYLFRTLWNGAITNIKSTFGAISIGLLFIMFFDHYLWDIQQGSFLLWMTLGFLVGVGEREKTI